MALRVVVLALTVSALAITLAIPVVGERLGQVGLESCMLKWLMLSQSVNSPSLAKRMETGLLFSPTTIDESTTWSISHYHLVFALGTVPAARDFLRCMRKNSTLCSRGAPCRYGGKCLLIQESAEIGFKGHYSCSCTAGHTGPYCEGNASCMANPCLNGGTCEDIGHSEYVCHCPILTTGAHCEAEWLDQERFSRLEQAVPLLTEDVRSLRQDMNTASRQNSARVWNYLRELGARLEASVNVSRTETEHRVSNLSSELLRLTERVDSLHSSTTAVPSTTPQNVETITTPSPLTASCSRSDTTPSGIVAAVINSRGYSAYCDRETSGGGWLVFQRRRDGSVNFNRDWQAYRNGFGSPSNEYWLGLETIHLITSQSGVTFELRADITMSNGSRHHYRCGEFSVGDEASNYRLHVADCSSPSLSYGIAWNNNMQFTTRDKDNDRYPLQCAGYHAGGWWHRTCTLVNVNGLYGRGSIAEMMYWYTDHRTQLTSSELKFRPVQ